MKRYLSLILACIMLLAITVPAAAARPELKYPVFFNGHPIVFDVDPEVIPPGVTMVPFRAIFEKMGATVSYDSRTQVVTAKRGTDTILLTVGSRTATVNGSSRTLRQAPYIKSGRTFVELRFVSEAFGATVSYDNATTKISIVDAKWPRRGGTLNLALWNKPAGDFNPVTFSDYYGGQLIGMMYDGLWRYDDRFVPVPALAEAWEWNAAGTKLTFYLRRGVRFHDGSELTADDVVFTYKAIMHPRYRGPANVGWEELKGYEDYQAGKRGESAANFENGFVTTGAIDGLYAADRYTVVFELNEPDVTFFLNNTPYGIVDSVRYAPVPVQDWGTARDFNNVFPNGTGAFKMDRYEEGQYAIFVANENYWSGRPYVDRVLWSVTSSDVAVGTFQRGQVDFAEFNPPDLKSYQEISHAVIHEFPDLLFQMMVFNYRKGITADKAVRQAMSYGIDRAAIIKNLMKDHASTMFGPVHPLTWAYTDEIEKYEYNPAKARQILDAAGWRVGSDGIRVKDGQRLKLGLQYPNVGNQVRIATAPVVQQYMKDIGVEIELLGYDWPILLTKVFEEQDFDMYFIGFVLGNSDPDPTGLWDEASTVLDGNNAGGFFTAKSEELIKRGKQTGDIDERIAIYEEWAALWADEAPAYIFYAVNTLIAQHKRLHNFKPGPWGYLWNIEELWLSE